MPPTNPQSDLRADDSQYQGALKFLYDRINYERIVAPSGRYKFRLRRIATLLHQLSLSHYLYDQVGSKPHVPLVHIAGTKGKGSTAAMVSAVLTAAGLKTGLYTSPHLHHLEERFRIDSVACSRADLVSLVERAQPIAMAMERELGPPSFFELTTALALLHFDLSQCDAIVLEVGLGGRLDSTNVCAPSVSVVTSIGLDHQHVLGNTLTQIAAEKAGIIKQRVPVVSGVSDSAAAEVVAKAAKSCQCELYQLGRDFKFKTSPLAGWGASLQFDGLRSPVASSLKCDLSMEGEHQAHNASLAIAASELLRDQGVQIPDTAVASGLRQLQCIGRIERFELSGGVTGIVDAAHNGDSINALCGTLRRRAGHGPIAIVFGTSIDKDAVEMLATLADVTPTIILTRFWGNPRFAPTADLVKQLPASMQADPIVIDDPIEACQTAKKIVTPGGTLVACGSFFLAAETRAWFDEQR